MPVLGLGVWQMAAGSETEQAVEWALEAGYRHIDTASLYRNEQSVGAALRRSGLPREQVFVTTKLMPDASKRCARAWQEPGAAGPRLCRSLLDPLAVAAVSARFWRELESLQRLGLAREIGVSNFGRDRLGKLMRGASRTPAVNQVQFSPFQYRRRLLDYCLEQGIVFEAYSPLERGKGLQDPTIAAVAARLDRTPAQVMLRWAIQHQAVVIPKSSREERIRSNAQLFDFELADSDMRILDALDRTNGSAQAPRLADSERGLRLLSRLEVDAPADQAPEDQEGDEVECRCELFRRVQEYLRDGDLDQNGMVVPMQGRQQRPRQPQRPDEEQAVGHERGQGERLLAEGEVGESVAQKPTDLDRRDRSGQRSARRRRRDGTAGAESARSRSSRAGSTTGV